MFTVVARDSQSAARIGRLTTSHGVVETPSYVIVGTHAQVRTLEPGDLLETKTQLIISNTYHLWRTLDDEGLGAFPGVHEALGWEGPVMTDSGGFQVFSLGVLRDKGHRRGGAGPGHTDDAAAQPVSSLVRVTDAGVYFNDPDECYLDAELSVRIQEQLGADIIVAFDEPTSPLHDEAYTRAAMERTHAWAERSLAAQTSKQLMYGVVQGGAFHDLRTESARVIGSMPFAGFAIGGSYGDAYGGTKADTIKIIDWSVAQLPDNKPRHLFGVGEIDDLLDGVAAGVDTFDCVIPTREARHGRIWTHDGPYDIKRGSMRTAFEPLEQACHCPPCAQLSITRAQLHGLFKERNPLAGRIATMHNIFFFNVFMEEIRTAIVEDRFTAFRTQYRRTAA